MRLGRSVLLSPVVGLALLAWSAPAAMAVPVLGVTISSDGMLVDNQPWNLGYSFLVNSDTNAVSLGVWDQAGDGLLNSHEVGLWTSAGTLLASTVVGAGTTAILDGGFRFVDIPAIPLSAGQIYYVAATFNGPGDDLWTADPTSLVTAPAISYDSRRYEFGSALVFPDLAGSNTTGYWGGNLRLDAAPVPEPATLLSLGLGLAALGLRRLRR